MLVLETPFDPQALYAALDYVGNVFNAASWQNLLKLFFLIALINGIISVGIYHKTDYVKQFLIALGFASVLSIPIGDTLAIKRSDTEKIYTINNSKAPFILVYTITTVNSVTKWLTQMAGASINSPNHAGMYDAGIGSNANIIRNSMDITFGDPKLKSDMMQFIKECTLYDIRDGAISLDALVNNGNGFDLMLQNTSPARFVSISSSASGRSEVKTCQAAALELDGKLNKDAQFVLTGKAANFFYNKDVAPIVLYSTAIQSSYQAQLNINSNVSQIAKQNMFNHLLEVSGEDIGRLISDPAMAESAAIHMGTARAAKKAAFQQSIIAQLGKELLPAMSSWFAIIIIMLFPFVVLIFVLTQFNNMRQILFGYMGTLFWICCWQPIFAIINSLANWELGRQLAKTGAFRQEGIPYGYVHTVYDTLLNNHAMVGWMVILTPIIAGMVVYGTYRGFSHLGNNLFSSYSGSSSAVGNEMSDGNLAMGNTTLGNNSLANSSQNTTSVNKYNASGMIESDVFSINSVDGLTYHSLPNNQVTRTMTHPDVFFSEHTRQSNGGIEQNNTFGTTTTNGVTDTTGYTHENSKGSNKGFSFDTTYTNVDGREDSNGTTIYKDIGTDITNGNQRTTGTTSGTNVHNGSYYGHGTTVNQTRGQNTQSHTGDSQTNSGNTGWSGTIGINLPTGNRGNNFAGKKGGGGKGGGVLGVLLGSVDGRLGYSAGNQDVNSTFSGNQTTISNGADTVKNITNGYSGGRETFTNTATTNNQVYSNMHHNSTGSRTENATRIYNGSSTTLSDSERTSLDIGEKTAIHKSGTSSFGVANNISSDFGARTSNTVQKITNFGLPGNEDKPAQWLHDHKKDVFDAIMSNHGLEPSMEAYNSTDGLERMNLRDSMMHAHHTAYVQATFSTAPPEGSGLPTSTQELSDNHQKTGETLQDTGINQMQNVEQGFWTNYKAIREQSGYTPPKK